MLLPPGRRAEGEASGRRSSRHIAWGRPTARCRQRSCPPTTPGHHLHPHTLATSHHPWPPPTPYPQPPAPTPGHHLHLYPHPKPIHPHLLRRCPGSSPRPRAGTELSCWRRPGPCPAAQGMGFGVLWHRLHSPFFYCYFSLFFTSCGVRFSHGPASISWQQRKATAAAAGAAAGAAAVPAAVAGTAGSVAAPRVQGPHPCQTTRAPLSQALHPTSPHQHHPAHLAAMAGSQQHSPPPHPTASPLRPHQGPLLPVAPSGHVPPRPSTGRWWQ